jgi:hypothetical protein
MDYHQSGTMCNVYHGPCGAPFYYNLIYQPNLTIAYYSYGFNHKCRKEVDIQWSFQEPKLEVPTIYKAYVRPM